MSDMIYKIGMMGLVALGICIMIPAIFIDDDAERLVIILSGMVMIVIAAIMFVITRNRHAQVTIENATMNVKGPLLNVTVAFDSIASVEVREVLTLRKFGFKMGGYGGLRCVSGTYRNGEFGTYKVCADTRVPTMIVVRHGGDDILVFNIKDEFEMQSVQNALTRAVKDNQKR